MNSTSSQKTIFVAQKICFEDEFAAAVLSVLMLNRNKRKTEDDGITLFHRTMRCIPLNGRVMIEISSDEVRVSEPRQQEIIDLMADRAELQFRITNIGNGSMEGKQIFLKIAANGRILLDAPVYLQKSTAIVHKSDIVYNFPNVHTAWIDSNAFTDQEGSSNQPRHLSRAT